MISYVSTGTIEEMYLLSEDSEFQSCVSLSSCEINTVSDKSFCSACCWNFGSRVFRESLLNRAGRAGASI